MVYTVGEMARLETFQHQRPPKTCVTTIFRKNFAPSGRS